MNVRRVFGLCACIVVTIVLAGPLGATDGGFSAYLPVTMRQRALPAVSVSPPSYIFPAGSSASFAVESPHPSLDSGYAFRVEGLPAAIAAEFTIRPAPYSKTLVLHTPATLAPGDYAFQVFCRLDDMEWASEFIPLRVTTCQPFQVGEYTQDIQSNLVTLITAGKPSHESGLLVPLQVCAPTHLVVTLLQAIAEDGTTMATPPRFYLYRSLVWPAPAVIWAHYPYGPNVELPRVDSEGWQLEGDLSSGLYLLIFERDYYGSSTDPHDIPARVNFRLE
jgi:hypothetical protein